MIEVRLESGSDFVGNLSAVLTPIANKILAITLSRNNGLNDNYLAALGHTSSPQASPLQSPCGRAGLPGGDGRAG